MHFNRLAGIGGKENSSVIEVYIARAAYRQVTRKATVIGRGGVRKGFFRKNVATIGCIKAMEVGPCIIEAAHAGGL